MSLQCELAASHAISSAREKLGSLNVGPDTFPHIQSSESHQRVKLPAWASFPSGGGAEGEVGFLVSSSLMQEPSLTLCPKGCYMEERHSACTSVVHTWVQCCSCDSTLSPGRPANQEGRPDSVGPGSSQPATTGTTVSPAASTAPLGACREATAD